MHTLKQLESGELKGITRLQLVAELTEFPRAIFTLADSLEILDLSDNQLSSLPDDFDQLSQLRILFLSQNNFTELPAILGKCPKLEMIGFKANQISYIAEDALPDCTRWLILTDNQLSHLPPSFGRLTQLRKLALAGNQLVDLPESMAQCQALELIRLSANHLRHIPEWLLDLPRLSWLAFAGNPFSHVEECLNDSVPMIHPDNLHLGEQLGQGASGIIYKAHWLNKPQSFQHLPAEVAVKIFKGAITSDGYPADELDCCLTTGEHQNLIPAIGQIHHGDTLGLVMSLIPSGYRNLGLPPSLVTCTRDTFGAGTLFTLDAITHIAKQMAATLKHMHQQQISHGDIYAHNIMIDDTFKVLFGDFGAASNLNHLSHCQREKMHRIEVRALGCLIEDLLGLIQPENPEYQSDKYQQLAELSFLCMQDSVDSRPSFSRLLEQLSRL
ncbi:leucine-rich repeat-containing protein kinase family protein [Shewanella subflava]|uniref:Leucine-rich repeat-containing serine/threonine-protein kinase n=1 Tax=Shewanella subflava TaxID=2986476 RepID=A0ABT3I5B1_9GAMM|nr:leucine-rich repeat-containing protein kinase family protein [Shewanella subflava]MCW3171258.1 leucine-rich repeat-containing serine/threonine-protein kinase [Shewanella subflava]